MIERWKRAVVNLECAGDAFSPHGDISSHVWISGSRTRRQSGTALFMKHNGRRYLLTARHVVADPEGGRLDYQEELSRVEKMEKQMSENPGTPRDVIERIKSSRLEDARKRIDDKIFNIIFRRQSFDEVIDNKNKFQNAENFIMNPSFDTELTDKEIDLAVIYLESSHARFADRLQELGYSPIPSEDFFDGDLEEGQEIIAIGFPGNSSTIGTLALDPAVANWSSSVFSLPVTTFGRVAMWHPLLNRYWADVSIYPGNSGGPLVSNNRLVGIVTAQALVNVNDTEGMSVRVPFASIIKPHFVIPLIEKRVARDRFWQ
ncbi:trypsin-like peptidase domain-containing protein [Burkholderia glumae]|uniref:S1 family peptidase n=1 Tax=Burkholderia glumae TaxID=337 RepID=UPI00203743C9|nr:serine protease [Burkholderia glumae]MCM2542539.1 serine protease [Burkholderia glumae]